jgi:hypothetical protein
VFGLAEVSKESLAQGIKLLQVAHVNIESRREPGDPMHEEHQMDADRKLPEIERRSLGTRQSLIQDLKECGLRQRCDGIEVQGAAALTNDAGGGIPRPSALRLCHRCEGYFYRSEAWSLRTIDEMVRRRLRAILMKRRKKRGIAWQQANRLWPIAFFTTRGLFRLEQTT